MLPGFVPRRGVDRFVQAEIRPAVDGDLRQQVVELGRLAPVAIPLECSRRDVGCSEASCLRCLPLAFVEVGERLMPVEMSGVVADASAGLGEVAYGRPAADLAEL